MGRGTKQPKMRGGLASALGAIVTARHDPLSCFDCNAVAAAEGADGTDRAVTRMAPERRVELAHLRDAKNRRNETPACEQSGKRGALAGRRWTTVYPVALARLVSVALLVLLYVGAELQELFFDSLELQRQAHRDVAREQSHALEGTAYAQT